MLRSFRPAVLALLFLTFLCPCARAQTFPPPVNDIVPSRTSMQRPPLAYAPLREADLMWQQRVWRVIDVREKLNHAFASAERPLVSILLDAAEARKIQLFSVLDDQFTTPLTETDRLAIGGGIDTIPVYDEDGSVTFTTAARTFDPATVTRYRLREIWYVDKASSEMQVRILGIAPLVDELDEEGNLRYERALFWVNFGQARPVLATERAWASHNETSALSWDDVFALRRFDSHVTAQGNVHGRRLQDIYPDGRSRLLAGQRTERERAARESDLWSY